MNRLHPATRLILAIAVLSLACAWFVPLWQIQLWAPQYPEGLNMKIWIDKLSGAFDIINGLNLDPSAAIQVPGMSYQPPLIGYKNLLNFTAYSGPDIGGWVMIVSGCVAGLLLAWEQFLRKARTGSSSVRQAASVAAPVLTVLIACCLTGCDAGPEPMRYGQDECTDCKMIVSDQRFGAEVVTEKGKVFKFDDLCCMTAFLKRGGVAESDVKMRVVVDFNRPNVFIPVEQALFLKNDDLKSPMRSDCAAFATDAELQKVKEQLGAGEPARWPAIVCTP